jgi:CobQ-like glutamine amidotransferase family enzyme
MLNFDRTLTLGDIGRILIFIAAAGGFYVQAQGELRGMNVAVQNLERSVGRLNEEVIKLRLEMVETRTGLENHMRYTEEKGH